MPATLCAHHGVKPDFKETETQEERVFSSMRFHWPSVPVMSPWSYDWIRNKRTYADHY